MPPTTRALQKMVHLFMLNDPQDLEATFSVKWTLAYGSAQCGVIGVLVLHLVEIEVIIQETASVRQ